MKNIHILFALACGLLLASSCGSDSDGNGCVGDYEQAPLLANTADAVILPALAQSHSDISDLKTKAEAFANEKQTARLEDLRAAFRTAYLSYQKAAYFRFGPSEQEMLRERLNSFPLNQNLLEANVAAGSYSLDNSNYYSGFPALDYLLYGLATDDAGILQKYLDDAPGQGYTQYLLDVVSLMETKIEAVHTAWTNGYREAFVANTGTADGTAVSMILNALNQQYEDVRRDNVGIPAGFHELNAPALPDKVEAYYSGLSLPLLQASVEGAREFFNGAGGEGLDDYLRASGVTQAGQPLDAVINANFDEIEQRLAAIPGTLGEAITEDTEAVQDAYIPMSNQVVALKTDAPTALCISITYIDNPSDSD